MTTLIKKTVESIYAFLLSDAAGEFTASYRYKTVFVLLAFLMAGSAAYAVLFMQS